MARARIIKPSFFTNEVLSDITPLGRLLFIGLWTIADREGRLGDRPKKIKAELLPYDECNVSALLEHLQALNFIQRYAVEGNNYIQILSFSKHQNPHVKESASTIPAPDKNSASTRQEQNSPGLNPLTLTLNPLTLTLNPSRVEASSPPKAPKGKRLDVDTLPPDWETFARMERPGLDPFATFDGFRDYWIALAGQRGVKTDWMATWRNWVRNQDGPRGQRTGKKSMSQGMREATAQVITKMEREANERDC